MTTVVYKTLHSTVSTSLEGSDDDNSTQVSTSVVSLSISGSNLTFSEDAPVVLEFANLKVMLRKKSLKLESDI